MAGGSKRLGLKGRCASIAAAVALAVVLAYSVEDQAKQAAHASAWDDIDQQVVAAA
jgi:hypothetical protein